MIILCMCWLTIYFYSNDHITYLYFLNLFLFENYFCIYLYTQICLRLKYFPKKQFLFLNGENFIKNPYDEVIKIENFLNLKKFIEKKHFVFGKNKGYFCLNDDALNITKRCMVSIIFEVIKKM
jgi:hypothetical protein